jgi:hypothetical protein
MVNLNSISSGETKTGSNCSGNSGDANRTLTLACKVGPTNSIVIVNGTGLHEGVGKDYTISGNTLTFLNQIDDSDNIKLVYFM